MCESLHSAFQSFLSVLTQISPFFATFGWKIGVMKKPLGGAAGKSGPKTSFILKQPPSKGVSAARQKKKIKGLLHAEKPGPKTSFVLKVAHVCVHITRNRRRKREMFDEKVGMRHRREIWAIQLHVEEVSSKSVSYVLPKTKQNRKHNVEGLQGNQGRPSYILKQL